MADPPEAAPSARLKACRRPGAMARLLVLAALLAACGAGEAKQPGSAAFALKVPPTAAALKRPGVAGVSAAVDARPALSLTFDAAAMAAEARRLAPAFSDDAARPGAAAPDAATSPAEELPLPKARHSQRTLSTWQPER